MKNQRTKVFQHKTLEDEFGDFVPWCVNPIHVGYVKTYELCVERKCQHLRELRVIDSGEYSWGNKRRKY